MSDDMLSMIPLTIAIVAILIAVVLSYRGRNKWPPGPNGERPYGVHGWLRWYIFTSAVVGPILMLSGTSSSFYSIERKTPAILSAPDWSTFKAIMWATVVVIILLEWWVAYGLSTNFIFASARRARILCATLPFIIPAMDLLSTKALFGVVPTEESGKEFVQAFGAALPWFLYFMISKRVKNTYPRITHPENSSPATAGAPAGRIEPQGSRLTSLSGGPAAPAQYPPVPRVGYAYPETPTNPDSLEFKLEALKRLLERGLVTSDDYERKKAELLSRL